MKPWIEKVSSNQRFRLHLTVSLSLFGLYAYALYQDDRAWADAIGQLIPILTALAIVMMIPVIHRRVIKGSAIIAAIAILSWDLGENAALQSWAGNFGNLLFILPGFLMTIGLVFLLREVYTKLPIKAVLFDFIAILIIWSYAFYLLLAKSHFPNLLDIPLSLRLLFINGMMDVLSLSLILLILRQVTGRRYRNFLTLILSGFALIAMSDIARITFHGTLDLTLPLLVDLSFRLAHTLILIGIGYGIENHKTVFIQGALSKDRVAQIAGKSVIILFAPVLVYMTHPFYVKDIVLLMVMVAIYLFSSEAVVIYRNRRIRLAKQQEDIRYLQEQVEARSVELIEKTEALKQLSDYDSVTGLYNRRYFQYQLEKLAKRLKSHEQLILYYIDMDKFKSINDTYGHNVGDTVLRELGRRFAKVGGEQGIKARIGGDEFVLAFDHPRDESFVYAITEELRHVVAQELNVGELRFKLAMSIGVTRYPEDADTVETLMRYADIAMYRAKEIGSNQCFFYDANFAKAVNRRNELAILLQQANISTDFKLFYQPLFDLDGNLTGAEAFCRWHIPQRGWILPYEFIALAEETGVIVPLGEWILHESLKQVQAWNQLYGLNLKMSVNISYRQMNVTHFVSTLIKELHRNQVDPKNLDLEIKESVLLSPDLMRESVQALVAQGIQVSIDEFGTGYSSLFDLSKLQIHRIKIARDLIDDIAVSSKSLAILKAIAKMIKALGFEIYLKGIETQAQHDIVQTLEIDGLQGYYYTYPLETDEFAKKYLKQS